MATKTGAGAGHGGNDPGAVSQGNVEATIARTMNKAMVAQANSNSTIYDLTVDKGYPYNINEPVQIANNKGVKYAIQNHFNAGGGTGVEVLYYKGDSTAKALAAKMSAAIAKAYGLRDRGAKERSDLGFINDTKMTAFIIEWGFVDAPKNSDCPVVLANPAKGVKAALGALGISTSGTSSSGSTSSGSSSSSSGSSSSSSSSSSVSGFTAGTYQITAKDGVNIRKSASVTSTRLGGLAKGKTVKVTSVSSSGSIVWGKISSGYIALSQNGTAYAKKTTTSTTSSSGTSYKVKTNTGVGVNIRSNAGASYSKVGTYSEGVTVKVTETKNGWGKTSKGWVSMQWLVKQ